MEIKYKVLDLSSFQGILSDAAVEKIRSEKVAVILRMGFTGYGSLKPTVDSCFEDNYKKLKAAGVMLGCYYFTIAYNQVLADREVDFILGKLAGKQFEFPIYIDCEGQTNSKQWTTMDSYSRSILMVSIMQRIEDAGYYVGIYSSKHCFESKSWLDASLLTPYDKWVAQWSSNCTYKGTYGMWQFTDKEDAEKYGITKTKFVDASYAYYDFPLIIKAKELNGFKKNYVVCPKCGERIEV